jgi:hypothetical protein
MIRSGLIVALFAGSAMTVLAHHGAGTFDLSQSVTYTGKLSRLEFINPHSWLYFEVTDANGRVSRHRCEMRSAHTLRRSGWSPDLFRMGQPVTIEAAPDRNDPNSCYLNTIKFQDGSAMDRYGQYVKGEGGKPVEVRGPVKVADTSTRAARRPSGEPNISGDWAPEQVVMANPRGTGGGLVPLSQIGERQTEEQLAAARAARAGGGGARAGGRGGAARAGGAGRRGGGGGAGRVGGVELTELGAATRAKFTQADNPRFKCETTSILFDWTFDGPVNRITQTRDRIVIQYGQMRLRREIQMNQQTHPPNVRPSRAGHSIGRWEGEVLVVDTVGLQPGQLTNGLPHGNQLHVVERFTLDSKTLRLTRAYTAEDPEYFTGQYTGQDVVQVADFPYIEDNCREQGFINYSEQASR